MRSILCTLVLAGSHLAWAQAPVITAITNFQGDTRICPAGVAQVFGTWPADGARNFTVTVGGRPGTVNVSWINRGVPVELDILIPPDTPVGANTVVISHLGTNSNAFPVTISPFDPLISFDPYSAFVHLDGTNVTPNSPATPGETITTFMNGLGVTNPPVAIGDSVTNFIPAATTPAVTVGGESAALVFAGLAPGGKAGTYQVSFKVPSDAPSGPQDVVVSSNGANSNPQTLFVGTQPPPGPPVVSSVVNGANFSRTTNISPGSFVSIFASGLGNSDNLAAFPATTVNGISVRINGKLAPIFHLIASKGQINALVPADADMGASLEVVVANSSGPSKVYVPGGGAAGPGIFQVADPSDSSRHNAAALFANTAWLVIPASQAKAFGIPSCAGQSAATLCGQPARVGDFIQLYVTGLGKATPNGDPNGSPLPTGQNAPADGNPVYVTVVSPTVTVGGVPAKVFFSGVAPGFAGLYQVNIQVPPGVGAGDNVPVQITMPPGLSDTATVAISQ